jgi:hypothetical protein
MTTVRAVLVLLLALVCVEAIAQTPPVRVRGTIEKLENSVLTVKTRDGATDIKLADNFSVNGVTPASLADVTPGKFVGIAAMPHGDGPQAALEVLIFPDSMRGTGEGHYPWDLQPESTMTNATVADMVTASKDHVLTLRHKGGEQKISVADGVPIVTFVPSDRSALTAGASVFVIAMRQPDGSLTAGRVNVGLKGLVPPM